jgi:pimeloyl-ACP methyl ester carboxylesterase
MPRKNVNSRTKISPSTAVVESSRKSSLPRVSGRWVLAALGFAIAAAGVCLWLALCLLFWQGSWQLLYHPASDVKRTPADVGVPFQPVSFASTDAGEGRLKGWWIPAGPDARYARYTVLYLHGEMGNVGDAVEDLASLHAIGLNVLTFDYRGYGQSQFLHPSERRWRQDADWALRYLTATRQVEANTILLDGRGLGANLALEVAAAHPELSGVVVDEPALNPVSAIFNDPRARLVPARLLVRDRFDSNSAADTLIIPSLWFVQTPPPGQIGLADEPDAYGKVHAKKTLVWLPSDHSRQRGFTEALTRWIDDVPSAAPFSQH